MLAKRKPTQSLLSRLDKLGRGEDLMSTIMDDLFHFHGFSPFNGIENPNFSPSLDCIEKENGYTLTLEVPGVEKEEVQIEVDNDTLIIKGEKKSETINSEDDKFVCERCYGTFRRELRLPTDCEVDNVDAAYKNGVLTISIPKIKTVEKEKKKIVVK